MLWLRGCISVQSGASHSSVRARYGGGLVAKGLMKPSMLKPLPTRLVAGDVNADTVHVFESVRDHPDEVLDRIRWWDSQRLSIPVVDGDSAVDRARGRLEWYKSVLFKAGEVETADDAARWILSRVFRSAVSLNVRDLSPKGWAPSLLLDRPVSYDHHVQFWSKAMAASDYACRSWQETLTALPGDLHGVVIYCDPPYRNGDGSLYNEPGSFVESDQVELIAALNDCHERGAKIAYSNILMDDGPEWYLDRFAAGARLMTAKVFSSAGSAQVDGHWKRRTDVLVLLG